VTSRRTPSTSAGRSSLCFDTDLQAYLRPVARSMHRYVVSNCPLRSSCSKMYSECTSNIGRCSAGQTRTTPQAGVDHGRGFAIGAACSGHFGGGLP
jgi:hypothetical protein